MASRKHSLLPLEAQLLRIQQIVEIQSLGLGEDEISRFRDAFEIFDKDGDGTIDSKELATVMRSLGYSLSDDELSELLEEVDSDSSGSIEYVEFLLMMARRGKEKPTYEEIREAFKVFDGDCNGYISASDIRHVATHLNIKLTEQDVDEMLREADVNADGQVGLNEFVAVMMSD